MRRKTMFVHALSAGLLLSGLARATTEVRAVIVEPTAEKRAAALASTVQYLVNQDLLYVGKFTGDFSEEGTRGFVTFLQTVIFSDRELKNGPFPLLSVKTANCDSYEPALFYGWRDRNGNGGYFGNCFPLSRPRNAPDQGPSVLIERAGAIPASVFWAELRRALQNKLGSVLAGYGHDAVVRVPRQPAGSKLLKAELLRTRFVTDPPVAMTFRTPRSCRFHADQDRYFSMRLQKWESRKDDGYCPNDGPFRNERNRSTVMKLFGVVRAQRHDPLSAE